MRTKLIVAILSFSTTFGFSAGIAKLIGSADAPAAVVQAERSTAQKITALLRQDIQNGKRRSREIYRQWRQHEPQNLGDHLVLTAEATAAYVDQSESISDGDLPADFQIAWRAHLAAWREHANLLSEYRNASDAVSFEEDAADTREINSTWYEVLRIGAEHGAYIPGDAY